MSKVPAPFRLLLEASPTNLQPTEDPSHDPWQSVHCHLGGFPHFLHTHELGEVHSARVLCVLPLNLTVAYRI